MSLSAPEEAAAILNHYLKRLAHAAGLRWSERNQADIRHAAQLLGQTASELPSDEIPPYQPIVSDRRTVVLDRDDYGDPTFGRWRAEKRADDDRALRSLLEREERAR